METSKDIYQYLEIKNNVPTVLLSLEQAAERTKGLTAPVVVPEPVKPAPEPVKPALPTLDAQTATVGTSFTLTLPDFGTRIDISDLPPGLRWNGDTRTISGTPTKGDTRTIKVNSAKGKMGEFTLTVATPTSTKPVTPVTPVVPVTPAPEEPKGNQGAGPSHSLGPLYIGTPNSAS